MDLLRAARDGNVQKVIQHIKDHPQDLEARHVVEGAATLESLRFGPMEGQPPAGLTVLEVAVTYGRTSVVKALVEREATVSVGLVRSAIQGGRAELIPILWPRWQATLRSSGPAASQEALQQHLWWTAVTSGSPATVQEVYEQLPEPRSGLLSLRLPNSSASPLLLAANIGQVGVVEKLLAMGAQPDEEPDATGATPLAVALGKGHVALAAKLSEDARFVATTLRAAEPETLATMLTQAAQWGLERLLRPIAEKMAGGVDAEGRVLHPERLNALSASGWNALLAAAQKGQAGALRTLLALGADANARRPAAEARQARSALALAAAQGHPECVRVLLAAGASALEDPEGGASPILLAAQQALSSGRHAACLRILTHDFKDDNV